MKRVLSPSIETIQSLQKNTRRFQSGGSDLSIYGINPDRLHKKGKASNLEKGVGEGGLSWSYTAFLLEAPHRFWQKDGGVVMDIHSLPL